MVDGDLRDGPDRDGIRQLGKKLGAQTQLLEVEFREDSPDSGT